MLGSLEENENQNRTKKTKEVQTHRRGSSAVLLSAAVSLYRYVKSTHKATGKRGEVKCPILTNTNSLPSCKKEKKKEILFGICHPVVTITTVYISSLRISLPPGQSYYNSESFQNSGGRDLLRLGLLKTKTKTQVFVSPHQTPLTSSHLLRKIRSLHLQQDPLSFFPPRNMMDTLCECVRGAKLLQRMKGKGISLHEEHI